MYLTNIFDLNLLYNVFLFNINEAWRKPTMTAYIVLDYLLNLLTH